MKKNLLLRLCLILLVALAIYSCRTDQFPETQPFTDNSKFLFSAKTISLNQSKHKEKLSSVILNVGSDLKKLTNPSSSDGIAVDTDHVVYIENGPNYYTYTFRVIRDNASENAPLENLVLSPLTDGTYRKLLFTYHLTPQEKQTLIDGGDVDTTGKITITDLGNNQGLPYGGMMNKNTNCQWVQVTSYTICSEGVHGGGKTKGCTATTKSIKLTSSIFLCDPDAGEGSSGGGDPSGGGTSGGGTGYCSPNGALTGPQVPNDGMGMTPCEGGIPTIPNPGGGFCLQLKILVSN
ncbi:hypothetical protein [Chryseobacterium sp.]|uniref:hypothetical protein n=1 Tax=Chryseobacterium sp. TaxID=1871047 RepID=UPI002FC65139